MKKIGLELFALIFILSACGQSRQFNNPKNSEGQPIISDTFTNSDVVFPTSVPLFVSLIQLKSPALLETATKLEDGTLKIDEELKDEILAEQEELKEQLQKISPDIKVIYEYKMVLNALAVEAPQAFVSEISELDINFIEADELFAKPQSFIDDKKIINGQTDLEKNNAMTFVGAAKLHQSLVKDLDSGELVFNRGQGVRVGIIDSGIDYTHTMFGGPGTEAAFDNTDANLPSPLFPSKRVVGGYDFVGSEYTPGSNLYANRIPKPDLNPIDQTGHGTHVAGTAAGVGDGIKTYDGAAPQADLFALKVFGDKEGGTSDTIIIAALEYAVDPNKDMVLDDRLDVLNISIGGSFGKPHSLYGKAIKNLSKGGILAVVSAGNSGAVNSIVGAPSTAMEALSVAASIGSTDHNWKFFPAVKFVTSSNPALLAPPAEGSNSKPIRDAGNIQGELVYVGDASVDLSAEVKQALQGKIAFVDRGIVSFDEKFQRVVDAGAIGVVVANNQAGDVILMGGEKIFPVPGVMVTLAIGDLIKEELNSGPVNFEFAPVETIERPELIDKITGFSSQGPRDLDALIKPEITAPGQAIISAAMGSGNESVKLNGTSMSSPLVTGVAALLLQKRPQLEANQLKSLLMNSSKLLSIEPGELYTVSRQGAGRVQADIASSMEIVFSKPAISLGKISTSVDTVVNEVFEVTNISDQPVSYDLSVKGSENIQLTLSSLQIDLAPQETTSVGLTASLLIPSEEFVELDAFIEVKKNGKLMGVVPVMAVLNRSTQLSIETLSLVSSMGEPSDQSSVTLELSNTSQQEGSAYIFNLLGKDERKPVAANPFLNVACDLESVGYRIVEHAGIKNLQISAKLFNPVTSWGVCDIDVDIDIDGDESADKQIAGTFVRSLAGFREFPGLEALGDSGLGSALFNTAILSKIFADYSKERAMQLPVPPRLNLLPALESMSPMISFQHSTLAIVEVPVDKLEATQDIQVQVSVAFNGRDIVERRDYLDEKSKDDWHTISLNEMEGGFAQIPEVVKVGASRRQAVSLKKGSNSGQDLVAYFPRNDFILETTGFDSQSQVKKVEGTILVPSL